jgi:hypothetical protein
MLIILIVLILLFGGFGFYQGPGLYRNGGFGLGGIVLLLLVLYLLHVI